MNDRSFEKLFRQSTELEPRKTLKDEVLSRAEAELAKKAQPKPARTAPFRRVIKRFMPFAACLCLFCLLICGGFGLYYEPYQTVYVDVNPSLAMQVNRFGVVNDVIYLNQDARIALENTDLTGKDSEDALEVVIEAIDKAGFFKKDAELNISVVGKKNKNVDKLLQKLQARAERVKGSKGYKVNAVKLTEQEITEAAAADVPPGKYKVIVEILSKYPSYSIEDLKDLSMGELKKLLKS